MTDKSTALDLQCIENLAQMIAHRRHRELARIIGLVGKAMAFELDGYRMKTCRCEWDESLVENPRTAPPPGNENNRGCIGLTRLDDANTQSRRERDETRRDSVVACGVQLRVK